MSLLELVNWDYITFQHLDLLMDVGTTSGGGDFHIDSELSTRLTPLCTACKHNREDLVSVLIHHGATIDKCSGFLNKSPLHFACDHSSRNLGIVRKLLVGGANVNAVDDDGNTGLHLACSESNVQVAKLLVEYKADVNLIDLDGETALVRACYAHSFELIDFLLKEGSDPNVSGGQPVEIVVRLMFVEALKLLMESGADIHLGAYLCHASEHNHVEMMKILHHYGADVNKANVLGMTPLQMACFSDQASLTTVRLLLHWGAQADALSSMKETALHFACSVQDLSKVCLLLAYGADVTAQDSHHLSPLLMALKHPSTSLPPKALSEVGIVIVRVLLAAGATLTFDMVEKLRAAISLLQSAGEKRKELLQVLDGHTSQARSLQDICRVRIRKVVKPNIDDNVTRLPLPSQVIRFLCFRDILDNVDVK